MFIATIMHIQLPVGISCSNIFKDQQSREYRGFYVSQYRPRLHHLNSRSHVINVVLYYDFSPTFVFLFPAQNVCFSILLCGVYVVSVFRTVHLNQCHLYGQLCSVRLVPHVMLYISVFGRQSVRWLYPSKHGAFAQCCFDVGPASKTVGQH